MDTTVIFFLLPFIATNRPYGHMGLKVGVVSTSADQILFKCYGGLCQICNNTFWS